MAASSPGASRLKPLVRIAGRLLMVLTLLFLGREALRHWDAISSWRFTMGQVGLFAGVGLFYGLSIFLLVENWHRIIGLFAAMPRRRTYRSYTMTQIAKYLPGNVVHLLGRAVYLRGGPLSDVELGQATVIELAILPLSAILFLMGAALLLPVPELLPALSVVEDWQRPLALGGALFALAGLVLARKVPLGRLAPRLLVLAAFATLFMAFLGTSFALIAGTFAPVPLLQVSAVAVIGWLAGYMTPGAPGGLGPREAVMMLLLGGTLPEAEALIAITVFRLVTILGDVLCFAIGWLLWRPVPEGAEG